VSFFKDIGYHANYDSPLQYKQYVPDGLHDVHLAVSMLGTKVVCVEFSCAVMIVFAGHGPTVHG